MPSQCHTICGWTRHPEGLINRLATVTVLVTSSLARRSQVEFLLPLFVGSIATTYRNSTDVAQWAAHSCRLPQPATHNGVRDGRSNWLDGTRSSTIYKRSPKGHMKMQIRATNQDCSNRDRSPGLLNTRPPHCVCGHSRLLCYTLPAVMTHTVSRSAAHCQHY